MTNDSDNEARKLINTDRIIIPETCRGLVFADTNIHARCSLRWAAYSKHIQIAYAGRGDCTFFISAHNEHVPLRMHIYVMAFAFVMHTQKTAQ